MMNIGGIRTQRTRAKAQFLCNKYEQKRYSSYEFIQNVLGIPLVNLKESFSARAAKAKASYTFNNLSPIDYMKLRTPSRTD
jgi:hypothetical protein